MNLAELEIKNSIRSTPILNGERFLMTTISYKADQKTIQEILNLYEKDHLNLEPGFQRSSVWALRDREKLIDSVLRAYPLPSIFLYRRYEDGNLVYDVIDGKQRIESVLMFTGAMRGNRFQARTRLPGDERPDWLDWNTVKRKKLQYLIMGYNLQIIEVTGELADIIDLFVRINSTGKALTGQEKGMLVTITVDFYGRRANLRNDMRTISGPPKYSVQCKFHV